VARKTAWCAVLVVVVVDDAAALAREERPKAGMLRPTIGVAAGGAAARTVDAVAALCLGVSGPTRADDDPNAGVTDAAAEVNMERYK
jgi:hypothetical protein